MYNCFFYSDLLKNPLIVPLKILKGHSTVDNFGKPKFVQTQTKLTKQPSLYFNCDMVYFVIIHYVATNVITESV